jgi:flagellar biosynthesis component FlhA
MVKTANDARKQTGRPLVDTLWNWRAEALWGLAVTALLFACVNPMIVLGLLLAAATITAACWAYRKMADGSEREEEKLASASTTHLRPAPSQRGPGKSPVHTPWHRHHAA